MTAVTAVGATVRDVFFAPEGDGSVAAVAAFNVYLYLVDEAVHDNPPAPYRGVSEKPRLRITGALAGPLFSANQDAIVYLVNRDPSTRLADPLKLHHAVDQGEQRVVFTLPHVDTGPDRCTPLAY